MNAVKPSGPALRSFQRGTEALQQLHVRILLSRCACRLHSGLTMSVLSHTFLLQCMDLELDVLRNATVPSRLKLGGWAG